MSYFSVIDATTGQVLSSGYGGDPSTLENESQYVVTGAPTSELAWWDGQQFVAVPPRPTSKLSWDWAAKQWVDQRTLEQAKAAKNAEIDAAREAANRTYFIFDGKQIATDEMSMKDILATNGDVQNLGSFVPGWPGGWKAMNGAGFVSIPDVATWYQFFRAMVAQGTANFNHSQALKATLDAATTLAEVDAISWGSN